MIGKEKMEEATPKLNKLAGEVALRKRLVKLLEENESLAKDYNMLVCVLLISLVGNVFFVLKFFFG